MEKERELDLNEKMEIIDEGIEFDDVIGPDMICCWGPYGPYRW